MTEPVPSRRFPHPLLAVACVALALVSCNRLGERVEITETREISTHAAPATTGVSSADRFYDRQDERTPGENPLTWTTPESWREATEQESSAGGMRLIDLRFGEGGEGECYLSAMPGPAGGLEANVNRWRGQMGLRPYTQEELELLPKRPFLGREAVFVSFEGDYKGVGADEALKGYRLLGLVQVAPEFTLFIKLIGPAELVSKNEAAFEEFCQSISIRR